MPEEHEGPEQSPDEIINPDEIDNIKAENEMLLKLAERLVPIQQAIETVKKSPERVLQTDIDNRMTLILSDTKPDEAWKEFDNRKNPFPQHAIRQDIRELNELRYRQLTELGSEFNEEKDFSLVPSEKWINFQVGEHNITIAPASNPDYEKTYLLRRTHPSQNPAEKMLAESIAIADNTDILQERLSKRLTEQK